MSEEPHAHESEAVEALAGERTIRDMVRELAVAVAMGDAGWQRSQDLTQEIVRQGRPAGVYAVTVSADTSDDPVRWLFQNEADADLFAEAHNLNYTFGDAVVSWEPIAYKLDDQHLADTFTDEWRRAMVLWYVDDHEITHGAAIHRGRIPDEMHEQVEELLDANMLELVHDQWLKRPERGRHES